MSIGLSYTPDAGSPVYNIVIDNFTSQEIPRIYQANADFTNSANGTTILNGPAFREKYLWAIDAIVSKTEAIDINNMFISWDTDRANGLAVAIGLTDDNFGATVNTSVIITTPPSFTYYSGSLMAISMGLTEI